MNTYKVLCWTVSFFDVNDFDSLVPNAIYLIVACHQCKFTLNIAITVAKFLVLQQLKNKLIHSLIKHEFVGHRYITESLDTQLV